MARIDTELVNRIVGKVLKELEAERGGRGEMATRSPSGVFDSAAEAVAATQEAQRVWKRTSLDRRAAVIEALRQAMHTNAESFARMAHQETGLGRVEDKIRKHHNAARATPGIEDLTCRSFSGDKGLVVEEYAPYGVVAAITPSTHPIPVLLNSLIMIIAPGNGVVFNVHPAAKKVSARAVEIFDRAIQSAGGPPNLATMVREPTLASADELFSHPAVALIAATGGPALVRAAFKSGKKVIAAGPGNPPVLIDSSADLASAACHIITGASFDNNILCIAEKEIFTLKAIHAEFLAALEKAGAVRLDAAQVQLLTNQVFRKKDSHWTINRDFVGKNAGVLARAAGLSLGDDVRLLFGETDFDHPFVQEEQMMPFLPVVMAEDFDQALAMALKAEHGYQHTAMIHSNNLDAITRFCREIDCSIVVVNGPSLAGNGPPAGEGYFSHTISSPTGEGVCKPRDFARVRRVSTYGTLRVV